MVKRWQPWAKSTGPKTPGGKERVSRNAWKGSRQAQLKELSKLVNAELRAARDLVAEPGRHHPEQGAEARCLAPPRRQCATQSELDGPELAGEHGSGRARAHVDAAPGLGSNAEMPKDSAKVHCGDCAHMSAAHTCMLGIAKGLSVDAIRHCARFSFSPYA